MASSSKFLSWLELAKNLQRSADEVGIGGSVTQGLVGAEDAPNHLARFDRLVTSSPLRTASRTLFADQHYARAVEEAFKRLNNEVKYKSGLVDSDGEGLMRTVFSVDSPILRLNDLHSTSEKDEQRGYMNIFAGVMAGIRNPRAHEDSLRDEEDVALELLTVANHLMRRLEGATRTARQPRSSRNL